MPIVSTDAAQARERLFHIIETLDDNRVIGLYEFLKDEDDANDFIYTSEIKARIEKVRDDYKNGKMENFLTDNQFKDRLKQLRSAK